MSELEGPISAEAVDTAEALILLCEIVAAGLYVLMVYRLADWLVG